MRTIRSPISFLLGALFLLAGAGGAAAQPYPGPESPPPGLAPVAEPPQTLVPSTGDQGGYGAPLIHFSRVMDEDVVLVGARGGWILDHQLVIGGGGVGLANDVDPPAGVSLDRGDHMVAFGYGGLWLEYIVAPEALLHLTVGTLIAGGGVAYVNDTRNGGSDMMHESSGLFVLAPEMNAELNLARFVRLDVGLGYRMVQGVELPMLSDDDLSGYSATLLLKFGSF